MDVNSTIEHHKHARKPWWREAEVAWLIVLVVAAYFLRADTLPIRGEEPTRAQVAHEMVIRHDWLVPHLQGRPFGIRPPLQNWVIAGSCLAFGNWDAWAVRFPSVLATLLTTLLIYGYSRTFLSRLGSLAAAAAFATLADMFQMGRQAETEALFIFLLSASLLTWHWGISRGWPDSLSWTSGYVLMALAMLTKGVQAPMYFLGSAGIYLVLSGNWRRLFSKGHVLGALAGAAVLSAWVVPYYFVMGASGVRSVWFGDAALTMQNWPLRDVALHLLTYPLEIVAGTLPWSLLLLCYLRRDFRESIRTARPQVLFLTICLAVAFPTCWIHPGGQPRFFAPLFPCMAVLIGLAVQTCVGAEPSSRLHLAWRRYTTVLAYLMVGVAAAVLVAAAFLRNHRTLAPWAEPPFVALAFAAVAVGLAALILRASPRTDRSRARTAVLCLACFLLMIFTGLVTDVRLRRSEDAASAMKQVKEHLPPAQHLVSFGYLDCLFSYHYGLPIITPTAWPVAGPNPGAGLTYFCFQCPGNSRPTLPFLWEEIGAVSLDRNHHPVPEQVVVVGRRLEGVRD